jgi:hypothetical protein
MAKRLSSCVMSLFRLRSNPLPHQCAVCCCRRRRQKDHPYCHRHGKQAWRAAHPVIATWRRLIDGARRRGREWALTTADFIEFIEETSYLDRKGRHRLCLHIDRIDSTRGYTRDNIQAITCSENTSKGNQERYTSSKDLYPF